MTTQFVEYDMHMGFLAVAEIDLVLQHRLLKNMFVVKDLSLSDFLKDI
jgi:hypothetical protein